MLSRFMLDLILPHIRILRRLMLGWICFGVLVLVLPKLHWDLRVSIWRLDEDEQTPSAGRKRVIKANLESGYGRSFTLADPSCNTPNGACKFTGGANAGPCSDASGILNYQEIQNIISTKSLTPIHDTEAGVKCRLPRVLSNTDILLTTQGSLGTATNGYPTMTPTHSHKSEISPILDAWEVLWYGPWIKWIKQHQTA